MPPELVPKRQGPVAWGRSAGRSGRRDWPDARCTARQHSEALSVAAEGGGGGWAADGTWTQIERRSEGGTEQGPVWSALVSDWPRPNRWRQCDSCVPLAGHQRDLGASLSSDSTAGETGLLLGRGASPSSLCWSVRRAQLSGMFPSVPFAIAVPLPDEWTANPKSGKGLTRGSNGEWGCNIVQCLDSAQLSSIVESGRGSRSEMCVSDGTGESREKQEQAEMGTLNL